MKKQTLCAFVAILSSASVLLAESYTLDTCFELALKKSHTLAIQSEQLDQAEQHIRSSRENSLPSLSLDTNMSLQDAPNNAEAKTFFPSNQTTSKIQFSIPVFKGFRDIAALKQSKLEKTAQSFAYENAKRTLKLNVTEVYFNTLSLENELELTTKEIQANEKRKKELITLRKLARAREVDVLSIEATIASLEANQETIEGQLKSSKVILAFLTDLPESVNLVAPTLNKTDIPSLSYWTTDIEALPSIKKYRFDTEATYQEVKIAKAAYFPSASFSTNYYLTRPGIFSDIQWDMGLSLSIPFLSNHSVDPKIKYAQSKMKQAQYALIQERENEEQSLKTTYTQIQSTSQQLIRLEKALKLAQTRYSLLVQDNQQGLATNIDVLQALASLYQIQRQKEHTEILATYLTKKIELLSGKRSKS